MKYILGTLFVASIGVISGCSSSGPRNVSFEEAMVFENAIASKSNVPIKMPKKLYTQPLNKTEACKLPTTQEQLDRNNFRAYWDGQCRDGYAYGLGRDIALSDTHHYDEITIHKQHANNYSRPSVNYDFINNRVSYEVHSDNDTKMIGMLTQIENDMNGFNVINTVGSFDNSGSNLAIQSSPFSPTKTLLNGDNNIIFKFTDNSAAPLLNPNNPVFIAETLEASTKKQGDIVILRYKNGFIRHLKLKNSKTEDIILPEQYTEHIASKFNAILQAQAKANKEVEQAKSIEREYLHLACNSKRSIRGLDKKTFTKICSWQDQFKEPFEKALAKNNEEVKKMQQHAETMQQQRQIQEQLNFQQRLIEQQQSRQNMQEMLGIINSMTPKPQPALINQPMQVPQVTPLSLPGSNRINCINVGPVTNCRY